MQRVKGNILFHGWYVDDELLKDSYEAGYLFGETLRISRCRCCNPEDAAMYSTLFRAAALACFISATHPFGRNNAGKYAYASSALLRFSKNFARRLRVS